MKTSQEYAEAALAALHRAADHARQTAALHGLSIPVWQDGRIIFVKPTKNTRASKKTKSESSGKIKRSQDA